MAKYRVKMVEETLSSITFSYKSHEFHIFIDDDREDGCLYCVGTYKDGSIVADGWLPEDIHEWEDAIEWALKGTLLV